MNLWSMWKIDKGGTNLNTVEITVKTPTRKYVYTVVGDNDPSVEVKAFHISYMRPFEEFTLSEPRPVNDLESHPNRPLLRVRLEGEIGDE